MAEKKSPPKKPAAEPNYQRRRMVALAAVIAVVAVIVWLGVSVVKALMGGSTADPTASETTTASETPTASESESPVAVDPPTVPEPCAPEDVQFTVSAEPTFAGQGVPLTWSATNVSDTQCTIDAAPAALDFQITSGGQHSWFSSDCGSSDPFLLLLGPGDTTTRLATWDGVITLPGCDTSAGPAQPGTYVAAVMYGDTNVVSTVFELQTPPPPEPDPSADPAAEGDAGAGADQGQGDAGANQ